MPVPPQNGIHEISHLYLNAIAAADKLIYIENQYFTSEAIYNALVERMRAHNRSRLQIVMILPKRPEAFLEEIAMGFVQAKMLRALTDIAYETGHAFGVYYTATIGEDGKETPTYIHSKLLLVDDRFLTVGSANATNRSMGVDTELNVSWEASSYRQWNLIRTIRHTRMSLLAEHSGVMLQREKRDLGRIRGLVDYLNRLANSSYSRLHYHPMDTSFDESEWLRGLKPKNLALDPKRPLFVEGPDKQNFSHFLWFGKKIPFLLSTPNAPSAVFPTQERLGLFTKNS
jgi:phosphatidylserine/phosphatidylglycerophosphate/cardiolipin synthase-like enzyme